MPPRKKADPDAPAAPTRTSTRVKAQPTPITATTAGPAKPKAKPATKASASKGKRAHESESEDGDNDDDGDGDDDDDIPAKKPPSKKAKTTSAAKSKPSSKAKPASKVKGKAAAMDVEDDEEKPAKMVTVIKRGAAPVDPISGWVASHQVYVNPDGVWDAMLNQTDVSQNQNKNKFYVLQLLHPINNTSQVTLLTRWGRVGEAGQKMLKGPFPPATAVVEFKKQFKAKAATAWEDRVGMVAKKGKYMWIERAFEDDEEEEDESAAAPGGSGSKVVARAKTPESTLATEVQTLCRLIFSSDLIAAHLSSMNYDANKLPLGKLAKSTILAGFTALKGLSEVLNQPNGPTATEHGGMRAAIEHFTSSYYSIIPHSFGRTRPILIESTALLQKELELVDALGNMEVASKLIQDSTPKDDNGNPLNPMDHNFLSLGLSSMDPIDRKSAEFRVLEKYTQDTHGSTHNFKVNVKNAFRVERHGETEAWIKGGFNKLADGERLLLWHGSRTTNYAVRILKQGLMIAPPQAPVTGYMFGKGVYFADMMSKSANYCYSHLSNGTGLLLLCEVAAKPFYELKQASYHAAEDSQKHKKLATKGLGRTQPIAWKDSGVALNNPGLTGCKMPDGPGVDVGDGSLHLQYNEYIVYDTSQIRLKYLLMVDMH